MSAREHYDLHLGELYEWMTGDVDLNQQKQYDFFLEKGITPVSNKIAVDLGSGHGIQSIPLARLGFMVNAIDFNKQLLARLNELKSGLEIRTFLSDISDFHHFIEKCELIVCMGDTLAHITTKEKLKELLKDCYNSLVTGGKLVLSFRDYSIQLEGALRYIPVKSEPDRILTCILDYSDETISVTDQYYENTAQGWVQKVSTYQKLRICVNSLEKELKELGFNVVLNEKFDQMIHLVLQK